MSLKNDSIASVAQLVEQCICNSLPEVRVLPEAHICILEPNLMITSMKKCNKCKVELPLNEFHKNKRYIDGLQTSCKECCKQRDKQSYKNRKQYYIDKNLHYVERNREFIKRYKQIFGKCVDCGVADWRVLQFDHLRDKRCTIPELVNSASSMNSLKGEIKKCEIRCANCHQIKTHHN